MPSGEPTIRECFDHAIGLDPTSRLTYMASLPPHLRLHLERLLSAHDQSEVFFDQPLLNHPTPSLSGRDFGPWRLLSPLGRGGMGAVYLAERADGAYQQMVAVKILGHSSLDPELASAFHRERQILAQLKHPNIASLVDGGATPDGLLYLVMELIEGARLDDHVRSHRLPVKSVLSLFLSILDAVQFAHTNLIIHRDLKPSNIMVTSTGVVKLLDFGIAKPLHQDSSDATMAHRMTPGYASPEQLLASPATTASDVYSLGVILYELLTGRLPYEARRTSLPELIDAITNQPPLSPRSIQPRISRDLELILLKALDKDPHRRYSGASQFADDIRRYLSQMPVHARPDGFSYRATRFLARNRTLVAFTAVLLLVSITGATLTIREGLRAQRRFNELRSLTNSLLFEFDADLSAVPQNAPIRRKITQRGLEYLNRIAAESSGDPSLDLELARAYQKLGDILGSPGTPNLGLREPAREAHQKGLEIAHRLKASQPGNRELDSLIGLGSARLGALLARRGQTDLARQYLNTAIQLIPSSDLNPYTIARFYLSQLELDTGHPQQAIEIIQSALPFARGQNRLALIGLASNLSFAYLDLGQPQQAVRHLTQLEPQIWALASEDRYRHLYATSLASFYSDLAGFLGNPLSPNLGLPCDAIPWVERARQILGRPRNLDGEPDDNISNAQVWIELGTVLAHCPTSPMAKDAPALIEEGMRLILAINPNARHQFLPARALVLIRSQKPKEALALIAGSPDWQTNPWLLYVASLAAPSLEAKSYAAKAREILKQSNSLDPSDRYLLHLLR